MRNIIKIIQNPNSKKYFVLNTVTGYCYTETVSYQEALSILGQKEAQELAEQLINL